MTLFYAAPNTLANTVQRQSSNYTEVQPEEPVGLLGFFTGVWLRLYYRSMDDSRQLHH